MTYNQLIILCAAQAIAAIIGILWGVKRIHNMEKAARDLMRGFDQLNTWDLIGRMEHLEHKLGGMRDKAFAQATKIGELENRLSDHIKVFDGHARSNDESNNVWSAVTHDLRRDIKDMLGEKEALRKLTEGTSIRITHAEAKLTAVADAIRELTPSVNELTAKVATLETQYDQLDVNCEHVQGLIGRVGQLELDVPRLQQQVEAIDTHKLHAHITSEIARIDVRVSAINSKQSSLESDFCRETKLLDERISGAYKAAQEAHVAAASVGSEVEKVRRMGTVSPEVADGFSHRLSRLENQIAALKPDGYLATKEEVQKMVQELSYNFAGEMEAGRKRDEKAIWEIFSRLRKLEQPSATQVPLKSRPIDDLAKEMLKQQQDQYIVVPADMGPTIEKMLSGPDVTEAIGKELGWSSDESVESKMNLRIAVLEKLVKNDVANLYQLQKKVDDICKNVRHKADEDTLFGHFDKRIIALCNRVANIEKRLLEAVPPLPSEPLVVSPSVDERRQKDIWRSLVEIKKLARDTRNNERHLSRNSEDRLDQLMVIADSLLTRLAGGSNAS